MTRDWRAAVEVLTAAGIDSATRDAQILAREASDFDAAIARRATHEPVSHILGKRAFWTHDFLVTADVLDPRPDTETLVEAALRLPFERVLDLGTGSGCILVSLLADRPEATGVGLDINEKSLEIAQTNAQQIGVSNRTAFHISDWFSNITGTFDLIVSNPPYIDAETYENLDMSVKNFEPKLALTPGGDGLDAYRIIAAQGAEFLRSDGHLLVEIGFDQGRTVPEILVAHGWSDIETINDLNGKHRVVKAQPRQK